MLHYLLFGLPSASAPPLPPSHLTTAVTVLHKLQNIMYLVGLFNERGGSKFLKIKKGTRGSEHIASETLAGYLRKEVDVPPATIPAGRDQHSGDGRSRPRRPRTYRLGLKWGEDGTLQKSFSKGIGKYSPLWGEGEISADVIWGKYEKWKRKRGKM
jgi:hypothetical protein